MRYAGFLLVTIMIVVACKQSAVRQSFSNSDSLVVFFKDESAGQITKTVQTAEKKAIHRVLDFIDTKETRQFDCGYDGKMFFYGNGQKIQEVDFKIKSDTCNHFAFMLDGKLVRTKVSNEAIDFFDALERGLPFYY